MQDGTILKHRNEFRNKKLKISADWIIDKVIKEKNTLERKIILLCGLILIEVLLYKFAKFDLKKRNYRNLHQQQKRAIGVEHQKHIRWRDYQMRPLEKY